MKQGDPYHCVILYHARIRYMNPETQPWGGCKHADGRSRYPLLLEAYIRECTASQAVEAVNAECCGVEPSFASCWRDPCLSSRKTHRLWLFHKLVNRFHVLLQMLLCCYCGCCMVHVYSHVPATAVKIEKKNTVSPCVAGFAAHQWSINKPILLFKGPRSKALRVGSPRIAFI